MMPDNRTPTSRIAVAAAVLGIAVAVLAALSGLGSRWDWWTFRTGFRLLRWAAYGAIGLGVLSLVAVVLTRPSARRKGLPLALLGLFVALAIVGTALNWRARGGDVPPIHDITTDLEDPPAFVAIAPLRADAPNPVEYAGPETAAQQREAYPDIQPLYLDEAPAAAYERALAAARAMGWEIVDSDPGEGRIEATATTFWFGFRDDVVVRLTADDGGTRVDVRSKSRVGRGDVGTNARRIRAYLDEVRG